MISILITSALLLGSFAMDANAEESYTQKLKKQLAEEGEQESYEGYSRKLKQKLKDSDAPESSAGYTNQIKQKLKETEKENPGNYDGYTEKLEGEVKKADSELDEPRRESAIAEFKEGKSELKLKRPGEISGAAGFKVGTFLTPNYSANENGSGNAFGDVYETSITPDFMFFYEYQPFHSEWFGNFGLIAMTGVSVYFGKGIFEVELTNPETNETFGTEGRANFQFFSIPALVGVNYRFNLLRILRPYVMAGAGAVGFIENRDDSNPSQQGISFLSSFSGGVSLLLDWMSDDAAWSLYSVYGIQHFYLTAEFQQWIGLGGPIDYTGNGVYAGLTVEF